METIRLYLHSMRMLIRSQMQYPASFFMQTLAQLVMEGGEMMAVILLVDRFERLNRWEAGDLFFFFGLMSVTFYLTECFGRGITGNFPHLIRTGQLDTFLIRPRGTLTQVLCSAVDPRRITCIAVGIAALVMGCNMSHVLWTVPKVFLMAEAIACGFFLLLGLFTIEGIFCIYAVKSVELVNALTYGGRSACEYPVDTYPRPLRALFTVLVPFALTMQQPGSVILDKPLFDWPAWTAFVSPLSGVALFGLIWLWFRKTMQYYRSAGS